MRSARVALARADLVAPSLAVLATLAAVYVSVHKGPAVGLGLALVAGLFLTALCGFLLVPHVALALTIPLFAFVPALKLFVAPELGPVKDLVSLAAICAAVLTLLFERHAGRRPRVDGLLLLAVAGLAGLYFINVGGGHGLAWAQGVRLASEPLVLLLAGMTLADPRRTLRWAMWSLIATSCAVALYGLLQQLLGQWRLVDLGYSFGEQIRTVDGHLRSFGTLDEPFGYAAFLLMGLAAVVLWMRPGVPSTLIGTVIAGGILVSWVRTAALISLALLGLWLGRRGHTGSAALLLGAAVAASAALLVTAAGGSETRSFRAGNSALTLNGRLDAWKITLGDPVQWPFGQGVGVVGTAADRAAYTISRSEDAPHAGLAVDSGYLATLADVGVVGLAVLLAIFARAITLARAAIRRGHGSGWLAAGLLTVLALDAVARSSFTGFPTAFLGLFLLGLALAAGAPEEPVGRAKAAAGRPS